jgi:hypothetical protein
MLRHGPDGQVPGAETAAWTVIAVFVLLVLPVFPVQAAEAATTVAVPSNADWVDTGITLADGELFSIVARGQVSARCRDAWGQGADVPIGPEGTYLVSNALAAQCYPLAAGAGGPAPCFCLIGRIGNRSPFFVGRALCRRTPRSGRLFLRINDFDCRLNTGCFSVEIRTRLPCSLALRCETVVLPTAAPGRASGGSRVVVFYVDGLRPDVVQEMVAMGHLPNMRELFLDGGVWMPNTFTAFPSDTITSNGTMWTGCYSDRHGLKGQVRFSRRSLTSESYLEPLGPSRSARLLEPSGIDRLITKGRQRARGELHGEEAAERWRKRRVTETPAIYHYLREHGQDWSTGILPLMTEVPPPLWTRSMTRELPWLSAHDAWQFIDDANTGYAVRHLLHRDEPVTILWFPETDSVSHKQCRGQFGLTRRTIAKADRLIGRVACELRETGRFDSTYFILVSDHGHHGGRVQHLRHFDLANDFFFRPRKVNGQGQWVGGGLGLSVRRHRVANRHPEHHQREFVFIDGESDGVARIFLPRRCSHSRDWSGPNRPGDLLNYGIGCNRGKFDLVGTLCDARSCTGERTIDLVLMRLNRSSILIATADRGYAVIDRRPGVTGCWEYRYRPVSRVWSDEQGGVYFTAVVPSSKGSGQLLQGSVPADPLGLTGLLDGNNFESYLDEQAWLNLTATTQYPDSVVSLTRHMLWQDNLAERENEFAPDLVVTARSGWYFGTQSSPGTMHGYPLADAVRASWFVSGPGVRRGARLDKPCRLVDLTPTVLDMLGYPVEQYGFDGHPIRRIYESGRDGYRDATADSIPTHITWEHVDLQSWTPLRYSPTPTSRFQPRSINQPDHRLDLNNTVYNLAAIADSSVFRVFDDVIFPLSECRPGPSTRAVEGIETRLHRSPYPWLSQGARVLNAAEIALSDYAPMSQGNLWRASTAVDWAQSRAKSADAAIVGGHGDRQTKANRLANRGIDGAQHGFWEAYRLGQRVVIRAIDEKLINGVENATDRLLNAKNAVPAEIRVR